MAIGVVPIRAWNFGSLEDCLRLECGKVEILGDCLRMDYSNEVDRMRSTATRSTASDRSCSYSCLEFWILGGLPPTGVRQS